MLRTVFHGALISAFLAGCGLARCTLVAAEPLAPGFNELTVIDPAADANGLPAPVVTSDGRVEVPPTLHIHSYYYSGDKEYQAQILQGGPTIVVANHPRSGEKMYVDVMLPGGAPVIAYNDHSITYVYPDQRVCIEFPPLLRKRAVVKYVHGRGLDREIRDAVHATHAHMVEHHQRSRLSQELHEFGRDTVNLVKGAGGIIARASAVVVERTRAVTKLIPGVQPLQSLGKQVEERMAIEEIRQAGLQQVREEAQFIPTNR